MSTKTIRAGVYARVSTNEQTVENQLIELRRYVVARGWTSTEYVDTVSGAKTTRPSLDRLVADAKARRIDTIIVWRLDRFGRNLRHLITTLDELRALDVGFISLGEGIDTTTPVGRLNAGIFGALAEFELERIKERIHLGLARARLDGTKLGRRRKRISERDLERVAGLSVREAATLLGVPASRLHRERKRVFQNPDCRTPQDAPETEAPEAGI